MNIIYKWHINSHIFNMVFTLTLCPIDLEGFYINDINYLVYVFYGVVYLHKYVSRVSVIRKMLNTRLNRFYKR